MYRDVKRMGEDTFDLLVVGGGVNGLAAAWDAILRGFKVALIDKGDFGGATSANSLKILHGGLRYLQHLDFFRMRQSTRERSCLMRIAPHLTRAMPFLVPTYGFGAKGRWALAGASRVNDLVGADRNRHLAELGVAIPRGRWVSRRYVQAHVPGLESKGLTGGVVFYDGQMLNADRMTLGFGLSAAAKGAQLANYVEACTFLRAGKRVEGVQARDALTGNMVEIRARLVLNMTGPWSQWVVDELMPENWQTRVPLSKGVQIVTPDLTGGMGLAVTSGHVDPDARLRRGGRHFFIAPWRGHSLIGTTDTLHEGHPDDFQISEEEMETFVREVAAALPSLGLTMDDVIHAFGGLQPLDPRRVGKGAQVAKKPYVVDHRKLGDVDGLFSVVGVKYTSCRSLGESILNLACRRLGYERAECVTDRTPLVGGAVGNVDQLERDMVNSRPPALDEKAAVHIARAYGTQGSRLLNRMERDVNCARLIRGSNEVTVAHVEHAVEHEAAVHLSDVVLRRTDLGSLCEPGQETLEDCASIMAGLLGWDEEKVAQEIGSVQKLYPVKRGHGVGASVSHSVP